MGTFTPLGSRVLLLRDAPAGETTTQFGLVIPESLQDKPQTATVVSVGAGALTENGTLLPMHVKVGDKVVLGKYSGYEVTLDSTVYTILAESDILGVLNA